MQGDQIQGENGVTRSVSDKLNTWNIQGDQIEDESGFTRSIIEEIHSSDS